MICASFAWSFSVHHVIQLYSHVICTSFVWSFSVIVVCYVRGLCGHLFQFDSHVLCGTSLSCDTVCWSCVIWVVSVVM